MKPNPGAVSVGGTVFRVPEITWLKAEGLTLYQLAAKIGLVLGGLAFFLAMSRAKEGGMLFGFLHLESLLGLLPIAVAVKIRGDFRLASTGDTEDTYLDRSVEGRVSINKLSQVLQEQDGRLLELRSPDRHYYYLLRPERVAWVSDWFRVVWDPLWVTGVFALYAWILSRGWSLPDIPILSELHLLDYRSGGASTLGFLSLLLAGLGLFAFGASVKRGLKVAAVGGVVDGMPMSREHRERLTCTLGATAQAPAPTRPAPAPSLPPRKAPEPVVPTPPEEAPRPTVSSEEWVPSRTGKVLTSEPNPARRSDRPPGEIPTLVRSPHSRPAWNPPPPLSSRLSRSAPSEGASDQREESDQLKNFLADLKAKGNLDRKKRQ